MIVSYSRNFVFVHVAKNAGSTVSEMLAPLLDPTRDVRLGKQQKLPVRGETMRRDRPISKHASAVEVRAGLGPDVYDGKFSFAFTRNPYARFLSAFTFLQAKAIEYWDQPEIAPYRRRFREMSIEDAVDDLDKHAANTYPFKPQMHWLEDPKAVTFLGRVENLEYDMRQIFDLIGASTLFPDTIPKVNSRTGGQDWLDLPEKVILAVADFYADDFRSFGYDTSIPLERAAKAP